MKSNHQPVKEGDIGFDAVGDSVQTDIFIGGMGAGGVIRIDLQGR